MTFKSLKTEERGHGNGVSGRKGVVAEYQGVTFLSSYSGLVSLLAPSSPSRRHEQEGVVLSIPKDPSE